MEYVEGCDLGRLMSAARTKGVRVPPYVSAFIVGEAAKGLHYAHERKDESETPLAIIHRDVSPQNILVSFDGVVKIADFGIGALVAEKEQAKDRSRPQVSLRQTALQGAYTPMYADRAQRRGEEVDARADVYAVGVIAVQLLMGDVSLELSPYFREDLEKAGVPAALIDVVARCLASPDRRYPDGAALLQALRALRIVNPPPPPTAPPPTAPPLTQELIQPRGFKATFARYALILALPFALFFGSWIQDVEASSSVYMDPKIEAMFGLSYAESVAEAQQNIALLGGFLWLSSSLIAAAAARGKVLKLSRSGAGDPLEALQAELQRLGYRLRHNGKQVLQFYGSLRSALPLERISVQLAPQLLCIVGPAWPLRKLEKRLRA